MIFIFPLKIFFLFYDNKKISWSNYVSYFHCSLVSYSRISSTYCFLFRFNYSNAIYSTLIFQICLNKPNLLFFASFCTTFYHLDKILYTAVCYSAPHSLGIALRSPWDCFAEGLGWPRRCGTEQSSPLCGKQCSEIFSIFFVKIKHL